MKYGAQTTRHPVAADAPRLQNTGSPINRLSGANRAMHDVASKYPVAPVERLVNLVDPAANVLLNMTVEEATRRVGSGDPEQVRQIEGQFALVDKQGVAVRMAR